MWGSSPGHMLWLIMHQFVQDRSNNLPARRPTMQSAAFALLYVLPCLLVSGQLVQICDPVDFPNSGPPLPDIPNQFAATIEGNLLQRSQSRVITEYYDQVGDRGKIEIDFNGTKTTGIYDYTLGEVFIMPDRDGSDCRVYEITPNTLLSQIFGFNEMNGTVHIGSPAAFLERIRENSSTIYQGSDVIRGIPVYRWQSCVALPNNSYLVNYYFASQSNWTYGGQLDMSVMIPVEFNLNASFYTPRGVDNAYNVYSFINFQSGPESVPDDVFKVPFGLACKGRLPGQSLPTLSDSFFARIEVVTEYMGSPVVATIEEYYDYQRNLFRLDFYNRDGPTTLVHDFNQGVQFRITQNTNKCTASPLSNITGGLRFDFDINSDTPHIASPNQLSLLDNLYNYSYEGVSTVRGIAVDSWVSVRDFEELPNGVNVTNAVFEIFFTRPKTIVVNGHSVSTLPVVVRAKISGNFTTYYNGSVLSKWRSLPYDFFDVSTQRPPYDAYDVSSCYDDDNVISVVLIIPGSLTGFNLADFRENIRESISNYTGVSPLQIASVSVIRSNGSAIFVHVHIANLTTIATTPQEERINSDMALQLLIKGTSNSSRPFTITIPPNITVAPSIHISGQGRAVPSNCDMPTQAPNTAIPATCPPPNNIQDQLLLKDREIIGVGIGLLFGGMIIGFLLTLLVICICRCVCGVGRGSYKVGRNVQYQKHNDDVAFPT